MTGEPSVDFGALAGDYAFFLDHSSETAAQIEALGAHLAWLTGRPGSARLLDFGCGTGAFTEALLRAVEPPPERLALWLVEPVAAQLERAAARLAPLAGRVTPLGAGLAARRAPHFDLILANHSLYYVPDLPAAAADLLGRLAPGGRLIAALLDRDNALAGIWQAGFAAARRPFPFALAEDLEAALRRLGIETVREPINYRIAFADSRKARLKVLRFLMAQYFEHVSPDEAAALFDPFRRGGNVVIETAYPHLVARRPEGSS